MRIIFKSGLFLICFLIPISTGAQYNFNIKRTFEEDGHQIYCSSYNTGGNYIVTVGYDNNIILWNAETGIIYKTLVGLRKRPLTAIVSPDNEFVASGGEDNNISLWDIRTSNIITTFEGMQGSVKTLDISPDGKLLAAGGNDRTIRIWNIDSRTLLFELKGHKSDVNALKFSPDGKMLASGGADKILFLWDISNGSVFKSKEAHKNWISDIDFSPDGKYIASCGFDNLIQIISIPGFATTNTLSGHKDWVQTIDFSPDGKYLLSGGRDQLIILWDVATGKILSKSEKQGQYVLSVDFCPVRSDFISTTLMSEKLETWALSGIAYSARESPEVKKPEEAIVPSDKAAVPSMIDLFSPAPAGGTVISDKGSMQLVGRVHDPDGISVLLINKTPVKISDAGIFEFTMNLAKGNNPVSIVAISNKGKMNEKNLTINCTAINISGTGPSPSPEGKYYALLIGINDYESPEINDLDNPVKDAQSIYDVITSEYTFDKENIIFLKNPKQKNIITTFEDLAKKLTTKDNLLIFYAGHGVWDDKNKLGYWFPSDAEKGSSVNWFRNSTLRDFIGSIQANHTLLIADACFSGAIFKSRDAGVDSPQGIKRLDELPSRKAMTSGILQEVPDESVFVRYLVKRLTDNDEKFLASELLFTSFKMAVMDNSENVPQFGVIQNVGDEGGDFIFIHK